MTQNQTLAQKWISDAAYFSSLNRGPSPDQEIKDWLAAEQLYYKLAQTRVKSGLVRIG